MVQLFLSKSTWSDNGGDDATRKRMLSLLAELESNLQSLILGRGRSEARLWLCNTISSITYLSPSQQREVFFKLLRSKSISRGVAAQLLHMLFEKRPHKAGSIIANKCCMLVKFFKGNPKRIMQWFSNFVVGNELEQRKGAKALSKFAFVNRDICWEELEWKGKHGQSPAMVATKPHYLLDLNVQATVENFLEYVPQFWSSKEFAESLKDGEILSIDTEYFIAFFVDLMYEEESRDVWDIIDEYLMEESFSSLSRRLLIVLEEPSLCTFMNLLGNVVNSRIGSMDPSCWLENLVSTYSKFESVDRLILLNAIINHGRHLIRLLRDEGHEEAAKIKDIVVQFVKASSNCNLFIINKSVEKEKIKVLGLQSWVCQYILSEECQSCESWESIFVKNGIGFRRCSKFGMIDDENSRDKRKRKERRRKRRRSLDYDNESEILDLDQLRSWYLSTDGYSNLWSSADLPEHLSKHCFSTWIKWLGND